MNYLTRDNVCSLLRLSPQQGYRIIGATEYKALISSRFVIELLNRSRVAERAIEGDGAWMIPSDLMTADEASAVDVLVESNITSRHLLRWSNRRRNPLPHWRINRKHRLFRREDIIAWLDERSPKI